jgi:hypothetical protein
MLNVANLISDSLLSLFAAQLWIHAAEAAPLESFQLSIFYAAAPEDADAPASAPLGARSSSQGALGGGGPALRFRVLRLAAALAVRPGLRAEAAAAAADSRVGRRLLHVHASAADAYRGFVLRRASIAGAGLRPGAQLTALGAGDNADATSSAGALPAGAARALLLALDDAEPGGGTESATSSLAVELDTSAVAEEQAVPPAVVSAFIARAATSAATSAPLLVALEWWAPGTPAVAAAAGLHLLRPPPPPPPPPALRARLAGACSAAMPTGPQAGLPASLTLRLEIRNDADVAALPLLELLPPDPTGGWRAAAAASVGDGDAESAGRGLRAAPRYSWTGATRRTLPALPPRGAYTSDVQLLFAAPGVTDVRRWRLSWRLEGEAPSPPGAPLPHAQELNPPFLVEVAAAQE